MRDDPFGDFEPEPVYYYRCVGCRKNIVSDYPYCDRCEDERQDMINSGEDPHATILDGDE